MHNAVTVAANKPLSLTRNLAAESSPESAAVDAVIESHATLIVTRETLVRAYDSHRRIALSLVECMQIIDRQRDQMTSLASELESTRSKRPRRRRVA